MSLYFNNTTTTKLIFEFNVSFDKSNSNSINFIRKYVTYVLGNRTTQSESLKKKFTSSAPRLVYIVDIQFQSNTKQGTKKPFKTHKWSHSASMCIYKYNISGHKLQ